MPRVQVRIIIVAYCSTQQALRMPRGGQSRCALIGRSADENWDSETFRERQSGSGTDPPFSLLTSRERQWASHAGWQWSSLNGRRGLGVLKHITKVYIQPIDSGESRALSFFGVSLRAAVRPVRSTVHELQQANLRVEPRSLNCGVGAPRDA